MNDNDDAGIPQWMIDATQGVSDEAKTNRAVVCRTELSYRVQSACHRYDSLPSLVWCRSLSQGSRVSTLSSFPCRRALHIAHLSGLLGTVPQLQHIYLLENSGRGNGMGDAAALIVMALKATCTAGARSEVVTVALQCCQFCMGTAWSKIFRLRPHESERHRRTLVNDA